MAHVGLNNGHRHCGLGENGGLGGLGGNNGGNNGGYRGHFGRNDNDGNGGYSGGYRGGQGYSGPLHNNNQPTEELDKWRLKEQLKQHRIATFDGKSDREGLLKWERSVEHFGRLAGLSETQLIDTAWHYFSPDVLDWFTTVMLNEYGQQMPPANGVYPFNWAQLKTKLEKTYSSIFADKQAWINLENLRRGKDTAAYQTRFTELASLVGLSPQTAGFRSRLWDIYHARMTNHEKTVLSSIILFYHESNQPLLVRHAMNVVDEASMSSGLNVSLPNNGTNANANTLPAANSTNLIPGPMELGAMSGRNIKHEYTCARCGGEGHWTPACGTPRHWKVGEPIAKGEASGGETSMVRFGGSSRGRGGFGGSSRGGFGGRKSAGKAQAHEIGLDPGSEVENSDNEFSPDSESEAESESESKSEAGKA